MRTTARRGVGRIRGASPRPLDALLALTLTVVVEVEVFTATAAAPPVDRVLALVTGLSVLMLAVRRCRPLATILVFCVAVFAEALTGGQVVDLGSPALVLLVAAYSLGAHAPPPRATAGVLVSVALLTGANQLVSAIEYSTLDDAVFFGLAVGLPAALGAAVTRRRALERRLGELVAWLEAEGDPADLALAAESARIGERIDAVATERLGEITLRAAGAERAAERDPAEVPRALAEIEHAARDTLEQMRTIVGALRREGEDPGLLALPSLSRLHELVGAQRADGARVELEVEGVPGPVDPGADAVAFRLVQETVRRGGDDARVRVRYAARAVELELSGGSAQRLEWLAPLIRRVELQGGDVDVSARDPLTVWARIPAERPA